MENKADVVLTAGLEDYLEAIYNIEQEKSVSRVKDIATLLDVRAASVTGALQSLSEKQLINYTPYEYITLTDLGKVEAIKIVRRHRLLKRFFIDILGIEEPIADVGACNVEHNMPRMIVERMADFMDFMEKSGRFSLIEDFKHTNHS